MYLQHAHLRSATSVRTQHLQRQEFQESLFAIKYLTVVYFILYTLHSVYIHHLLSPIYPALNLHSPLLFSPSIYAPSVHLYTSGYTRQVQLSFSM